MFRPRFDRLSSPAVMAIVVTMVMIATAASAEQLRGAALSSLLTDKTLEVQAKEGARLFITYDSNGSYCQRSVMDFDCEKYDPYVGYGGPWRVHNDQLCMTHPKFGNEACYDVLATGPDAYSLRGPGGFLDDGTFTVMKAE